MINGIVIQDDGNCLRLEYMSDRTVCSPEDMLMQLEELQELGCTIEELAEFREHYINAR